MLGWPVSRPAARCSRMNRSRFGSSRSAVSTLTATVRSRAVCVHRYTIPKPPRPISRASSNPTSASSAVIEPGTPRWVAKGSTSFIGITSPGRNTRSKDIAGLFRRGRMWLAIPPVDRRGRDHDRNQLIGNTIVLPSAFSSGSSRVRGALTTTGNTHARRRWSKPPGDLRRGGPELLCSMPPSPTLWPNHSIEEMVHSIYWPSQY